MLSCHLVKLASSFIFTYGVFILKAFAGSSVFLKNKRYTGMTLKKIKRYKHLVPVFRFRIRGSGIRRICYFYSDPDPLKK